MVEPLMYFGIGFLFATLLAIVLVPLVHGRAVRLTMRRLEASTPLSMAEIQADKDQLRAEFAMSTRRLEMSVEQMQAKATSQLAEIGKKSEAVNRLKAELGEKNATLVSLEERERALKEQLRISEDEYAARTATLRDAEHTLSDKQTELERLTMNLDERSVMADSQRIEIVALRTQIEALKQRVGDTEKEVAATEARLERERDDTLKATRDLLEERSKAENLNARIGELERHLIAQTTEANLLQKRVQELEERINQQGGVIAERNHEMEKLQTQLGAAVNTESKLRAALATAEGRFADATRSLLSEKALREQELQQAQTERTRLQSEIAAMKREAEAASAAERVENALLRERINDVAAEVAKLTVTLEGPNSPIEAILAGDTLQADNGSPRKAGEGVVAPPPAAGVEPKGNLAERMRALQSRASRVASNS